MKNIDICSKCGETGNFQFTFDYSKAHRPVINILCNNCGELFPPALKLPKEEPKQTDEKGNPLTYWGGLEKPKQDLEEVECNNCGNIMSLTEDGSIYVCYNSECTSCYETYEEEEPKDVVLGYKTSLDAQMLDKVILEEPKQEYEYIGECKGNNGNGCFMDNPAHNCGCFVRKPKQETPKETAARLFTKERCPTSFESLQEAFISNAKFNAAKSEIMYTEEEVYSILEQSMKDCHSWELEEHYSGDYKNLKEWFEQFKKK